MNVFENLGEAKAKELYDKFIAEGMSDDDAFGEVYSIECNMDENYLDDDDLLKDLSMEQLEVV